VFALLKKELASYFSLQIAYLSIGIFLLISGGMLWLFPEYSILIAGYATLQPFFDLAPYLFLFLIPAITMRTFAEERALGTDELLLTRPLSVFQLIWAKYLAAFILSCLSLVPTLFYVFSIYQLGAEPGNLDAGATFGSYLGLICLAAVFTAIGIFASSLSKNQVISFLFTAGSGLFLFLGFDALGEWSLLNSLSSYLQVLGIQAHYQSISRGVLSTNDLIYFIDLILLFLGLAVWNLNRRGVLDFGLIKKYGLSFAVFLMFNISCFAWPLRYDFSAEKRYTISETSKKIAAHLEHTLKVNIYLTGELPPGFRQLSKASKDFWTDLKRSASVPIQVSFINPNEGNVSEQQKRLQTLYEEGIEPTNLSVKTEDGTIQKLIFPKALLEYQNKKIIVDLLQARMGTPPELILNNSIQNLEYAFASAINKLLKTEKPRVGFTEGHGELSDLALSDAMRALENGFTVGRVDLEKISKEGLNQLSILVIPKPLRPFTEAEKFKLDYFITNGGRLLMAIDQSNADLDSLRTGGDQLAYAHQLNLDDLLFKYGIRLNYDLIADLNCAQIPMNVGNLAGEQQVQLLPWFYYPVIMPLIKHPIVKNLEGIRTEFAGSIDTLAVKGLKRTVLLSSSPYSKLLTLPGIVSLQTLEQNPDPESFKGISRPLAVLSEGIFNSAFENRPLPTGLSKDFSLPSSASKPSKLLVVADGDILKSQQDQDGAPYPLGFDRFSGQVYGNKAFLLNAIDYLSGDGALISLRNKDFKLRMLDRGKIKNEKRFWQALNLLGPLSMLGIFGFFQHWYRKRKYTV
jgi:ABC-2 type transport system permease protein